MAPGSSTPPPGVAAADQLGAPSTALVRGHAAWVSTAPMLTSTVRSQPPCARQMHRCVLLRVTRQDMMQKTLTTPRRRTRRTCRQMYSAGHRRNTPRPPPNEFLCCGGRGWGSMKRLPPAQSLPASSAAFSCTRTHHLDPQACITSDAQVSDCVLHQRQQHACDQQHNMRCSSFTMMRLLQPRRVRNEQWRPKEGSLLGSSPATVNARRTWAQAVGK